jgi:hypothetical protein
MILRYVLEIIHTHGGRERKGARNESQQGGGEGVSGVSISV